MAESNPLVDTSPPKAPSRHPDRRMRACVDANMFAFDREELGEIWFDILFGTAEQKDKAITRFGEAVADEMRP